MRVRRTAALIGLALTVAASALALEGDNGSSTTASRHDQSAGMDVAQKIVPGIFDIQDNLTRTIKDYTTDDDLGMIQMLAPVGWTEPIVSLDFELRGIVLAGTLGLEFADTTQTFQTDTGFIIPANTKVRIHNAGDGPLHLIEILRPRFLPSRARQFATFD